jgi:hypothetical protein
LKEMSGCFAKKEEKGCLDALLRKEGVSGRFARRGFGTEMS